MIKVDLKDISFASTMILGKYSKQSYIQTIFYYYATYQSNMFTLYTL